MLYFTRYAEQKFEILNRHKVYLTREEIEDAVNRPERVEKKGRYFCAQKEAVRVVFQKERGIKKIITFYPAKTE